MLGMSLNPVADVKNKFQCCVEKLHWFVKTSYMTYNSVTILGNYLTLGHFLKRLETINFPKSPTFIGNFCKSVKIYHFSSEIIFGQLL